MKFAIIADIHANLEAFQVVLEDIKEQKCTERPVVRRAISRSAELY